MKTLTFLPDRKQPGHYFVKETGWLCSLPKAYKGNLYCIENYSAGTEHSAHPNIDASGSVTGMKKLGYWRKDATINRTHGAIYNMSSIVCSDPLDELCHALETGAATKTTNPETGAIIFNFEL